MMPQLLDRYRRVSDGKEFAVISLGPIALGTNVSTRARTIMLEAEDGERVESQDATLKEPKPFERLED